MKRVLCEECSGLGCGWCVEGTVCSLCNWGECDCADEDDDASEEAAA